MLREYHDRSGRCITILVRNITVRQHCASETERQITDFQQAHARYTTF